MLGWFFFLALRYYLDTLPDQNEAPAAHLCLLIPCSYISITPKVPPFSPAAATATARPSATVAQLSARLHRSVLQTGVEARPKGMGSSAVTGGDRQGELRPGFSAGAPGYWMVQAHRVALPGPAAASPARELSKEQAGVCKWKVPLALGRAAPREPGFAGV